MLVKSIGAIVLMVASVSANAEWVDVIQLGDGVTITYNDTSKQKLNNGFSYRWGMGQREKGIVTSAGIISVADATCAKGRGNGVIETTYNIYTQPSEPYIANVNFANNDIEAQMVKAACKLAGR